MGTSDAIVSDNVESVSIRKDEIAASIDLFHALWEIVANHDL
jgi:hypothetical protein